MSKKAAGYPSAPVLPLRNAIMVPYIITPILVGRPGSLEAIESAYLGERDIICIAQRKNMNSDDDPKARELYRVGTVCRILQIFRMPDGNARVLLEGKQRVRVKRFQRVGQILEARYEPDPFRFEVIDLEAEALLRSLHKTFIEYIQLTKSIPEESLLPFQEIRKPDEFLYFALINLETALDTKQRIFEIQRFDEALQRFYEMLSGEIEIIKLERKIDSKVKGKLSKLQREYYLNEQLKVIHRELGITQEEKEDLLAFRKRIADTPLSGEARKHAEEELKKLSRITHHSQEYTVVYNYLNWILSLPWSKPEQAEILIGKARNVLDEDHYGLDKVKERILEYLAVMKVAGRSRGQILCFVGPPGVGKTSLGKSIARSLSRKFIRLSLGGVRDEAEIRGHRRTYVGALPGVIIQSMKKAGARNPLIMMDEIDKMSVDFRGDPSAALLEVLDSEQNHSFRDHYLDFGYDLSDVLFITTCNTLSTIPAPLRDRMEIIHLPGYTAFEKMQIAQRHLLPKQLIEHEIIGKIEVHFQPSAIEKIIGSYTREAGVRELERKIAAILRKIVRIWVEKPGSNRFAVTARGLSKFLGAAQSLYPEVNRDDAVGIVTGLAWTNHGGETLQVEVVRLAGEGKIKLTGKLGEVMKESAQAAHSYARHNAADWGVPTDFHKNFDLHLHIPEGAIPKDGPSAGVSIVTAMISALSGRKVRAGLAMTGEITLSGRVLPIGGLEEKLIAAKRAGIKTILLPVANDARLKEIKKEVTRGLDLRLVSSIDEVLEAALVD
ncbi:MAG: endopeptidase La [Candidatus Cloacimonetes bacterium]|nr:endopeptidase La [Candidatus Cloacimonadota bacterium]